MASQLMRGLQKFLAPVLRRGQHDYFPRTMKLHNGEKSKQVYSAQEMERRLNSIRSHMEKDGVDACVFTSYYNIYYFSDFLFCSFGRPYAFIVTDEKTISVTPSVDYGHPWRRTSGENISYTNWNKDNFYYAIQQQVQSASTVGFEFPEMGVNALKSFSELLPQAKFVDVAEQAMEIRRTKSPEELDVIRKGSKIAELGGYAAIKAIHEGVPEYEVALAATNTIVREIAAEFPQTDIRDSWAWLQSGVNTDGAHDFPTTRRVQKGDILSLNCFPMIAGNYTALERTLFYDHASERHMEIWEINNKVHRRGLEITKPGVRCGDVARELNEIYREHDLLQYRTIGYGHSTGVMCHYFGRDWGLEFLEHVDTVLEPGMVITMEPMIVVPEGQPGAGGYREHDTMIITETGIENTTASFPIGPSQNIIKN